MTTTVDDVDDVDDDVDDDDDVKLIYPWHNDRGADYLTWLSSP